MRKAIAILLLLLAGACAPVALTLDTDLEKLRGQSVVVYIGDPAEITAMCAQWGLPGSLACTSMATIPAEKTRMLHAYTQHMAGFGLDCVILSPPSPEALMHELTLCALKPAWYWNKADPKA